MDFVAGPPWMRTTVDAGKRFLHASKDDRITGLAAEVAFFGLLSVFPTLIAVAAAFAFVDSVLGARVADDARAAILDWLTTFLTDRASSFLDAVRNLLDEGSGEALTVGIAFAVWSGSRGIDALVRAVALVYDVEEERSWWRRRAFSLALLLLTAVAVGVIASMFVVGPLLGGGQEIADRAGFGAAFAALWRIARFPFAVAASAAWALVVLRIGGHRGRWRDDAPGALVTAVLWVAVSFSLRLYLASASELNDVLGTLGGALIVLLWLFLLALALLVGAEVNAVRADARHGSREARAS